MSVFSTPLMSKLLPYSSHDSKEFEGMSVSDWVFSYDFREKNKDKPVIPEMGPFIRGDIKNISLEELSGWMAKEGLKEGGATDVAAKIDEFFQGAVSEDFGRLQLPLNKGGNSCTYLTGTIPTVFWLKECKSGQVYKFAVNRCEFVGKGSRVVVYKIPVVSIDRQTGKISIKPKALFVHMPKTQKEFIAYVGGYEKGIAILKEVLKDEDIPYIAPAPRRLGQALGLYTQRFF